MDAVLAALEPHLRHLARPYADRERPDESTSDLMQEACLRAWQKVGSFEGGQADDDTFRMFRVWIGRIVERLGQNTVRDNRAQRRRPPGGVRPLAPTRPDAPTGAGDLDPPAADPTPSAAVRGRQLKSQVEAVLAEMPAADADIARMHFFQGMRFSEIAEKLGLDYHHVRGRYLKIARLLEERLGDWT
jgi:RNA polymerase sigma factor (sigma-70 family)